MAEAKAGEGQAQSGDQAGLNDVLLDEGAQFVDVELGGVDDRNRRRRGCGRGRGARPGCRGDVAVLFAGEIAVGAGEGMGAAGLAEAADEGVVAGLQKQQGGAEAGLLSEGAQVVEDVGQIVQAASLADIDHGGEALDFAGLADRIHQAGDQVQGQVVDAVVAGILEDFDRGNLAGTA